MRRRHMRHILVRHSRTQLSPKHLAQVKGAKERLREIKSVAAYHPLLSPVRGVHNGHTDSAVRAKMRTFRMDTPRTQTNLPCFSADNNDKTWRTAVM